MLVEKAQQLSCGTPVNDQSDSSSCSIRLLPCQDEPPNPEFNNIPPCPENGLPNPQALILKNAFQQYKAIPTVQMILDNHQKGIKSTVHLDHIRKIQSEQIIRDWQPQKLQVQESKTQCCSIM